MKIYGTGSSSFFTGGTSRKKRSSSLPASVTKSAASKSTPKTDRIELSLSASTNDPSAKDTRVVFTDRAQISRAVSQGSITVGDVEYLLSDDAKKELSAIGEDLQAQQEAAAELNAAQSNAEVARQQGEAISDAMKKLSEILKIFSLYSSGKKVAAVDVQRLMTEEPDLYKAASAMRMLALQRKKEDGDGKQITQEDDADSAAGDAGNAADFDPAASTPSVEVAAEITVE